MSTIGKSQTGATYKLAFAFETVAGTAPASGFIQMPCYSCDIDETQDLESDDLLGLGRDAQDPIRGVIDVGGNVEVPVDVVNFGYWLKATLGAAVTTGAGPFTHTFKSGDEDLPTFSSEKQFDKVPLYEMATGLKVDNLGISFERNGTPKASIAVVGQGQEPETTTQAGTLTVETLSKFNQLEGSIKKDGVALGAVQNARIAIGNNLDRVESIRNDGKIDGLDETKVTIEGEITVRFRDTELYNLAQDGTPMELEFAYTKSNGHQLKFTVHRAFLPITKKPVGGPEGIDVSYNFMGAKDDTAGCALTVELVNDKAAF